MPEAGTNLYAIFTAALRYSAAMEIRRDWIGYGSAVLAALGCTLAGMTMSPRFDIVNIAMVYLLAVVVIALRCSRGAAVASAALSVALFDIVFVPPAGTFTIHDTQYLFTFAIMLVVALVISSLMAKAKREGEMRTALALEAATERMRSTLLASISHDLRTPLAVMAGASSSLVEGGATLSDAERDALAKSIFGQARDMSEQVDKVLQMTRLEMGGIELQRDWASVAEIIGTALSRMAERLAQHKVVADIPGDLPLVRVDAPLMVQVFANLLENAARHTPPGTLVHLKASRAGGELAICVDDFGPGLEDRDIGHIFDKFHGHREEGPLAGLGLGLAICRAIISLHGGSITAEQIPGGGTSFRVVLQLEQMPLPPQEAAEVTDVVVADVVGARAR